MTEKCKRRSEETKKINETAPSKSKAYLRTNSVAIHSPRLPQKQNCQRDPPQFDRRSTRYRFLSIIRESQHRQNLITSLVRTEFIDEENDVDDCENNHDNLNGKSHEETIEHF